MFSNSSGDDVNVIGNAAPVLDSTTKRIWVPFCRNNEEVFITYSDDDGITWSPPTYQPQLVLEDWKWVGLGPPAGLQLNSVSNDASFPNSRIIIPSYHTTLFKGDGCASKGHIVYSDDHGLTWQLCAVSFGSPYFANECQAVQLRNGSILINARTISTSRVQILSNDGGITFENPLVVDTLQQTIEGCEGSIVRDVYNTLGDISPLYFSNPNNDAILRRNMTIFQSMDEGNSWQYYISVDIGAVSYSALQVIPPYTNNPNSQLVILYERSNTMSIVFEPDEIVLWRVTLG